MRATPRRAARRATAIGVLGLAVALLPVGAVTAPTAAPAAPAPAAASAGVRAVALPSGDRPTVRTDPSGRLMVSPERAGTPMTVREINGEVYAFPLAAERRPGFDPARYDVSALLRGETTAPPAVHPDYPMRTVTLNAIDDQGGPVASTVLSVVNDDNTRIYDSGVVLQAGVAKISIPDGHYTALLDNPVFDAAGQLVALKVAFVEFTVAGAPVTETLDARTATHTASVTTPRPHWGVESALDLDMASAACPGCKLLLVEGDDSSFGGLAAAVDTAVRLGATVVSNSYGTFEFNGMDAYAGSYDHPGVPILVSSGDFAFQAANFPAVLGSVIPVGGTSLTRDSSARGWSEQGLVERGVGLLGLDRQTGLADRPQLRHAHRRRHLRRRRP